MSSLILRAGTRILAPLMLMFSVFLLWRGHNLPGGGFIGGLVAASAIALQGIAFGPDAIRRTLVVPPAAVAGAGVLIAAVASLPAALAGLPFFTGLWLKLDLGGGAVLPLSTPLLFDVGVYLTVIGSACALIAALEEEPSLEDTRERG
ncbi:MAG: Na+/H+ antiporter subunit B [Acetobacteraceae bacterium]|nr:Na+/H+ antiporter subunit B [Acetobacteraceae bacterium]